MTRYLLIAFAAASSVALAQEPSRFRAVMDNFGRHTYRVELRDGKLVYEDSIPKATPTAVSITPSGDQWRAFRRALDQIGVWTWRESYQPSKVVFDGTSWSLSVWYPNQHVVTDGRNCYPDAHGEPTGVALRTPAFRQFETAVEALLGGKPFRSDDQAASR